MWRDTLLVSDYFFTSYGIVARSVTAVCRYFARIFLTISLLDIDNGKVFCCMKRAVSDSSVASRNAVLHVVFLTESSSFYLFKEIIYKLHILNLRQASVWQSCGNNVDWRIILAVDVAATVSILIYFFLFIFRLRHCFRCDQHVCTSTQQSSSNWRVKIWSQYWLWLRLVATTTYACRHCMHPGRRIPNGMA